MSTSAQGRIVDEHNAPHSGINVILRDVSALFATTLGQATSGTDGRFMIGNYEADSLSGEYGPRHLSVGVMSVGHRLLAQHDLPDVAGPTLNIPDIQIPSSELSGLAVTLGGKGQPFPVRDGNGVRFLIDNTAAWAHLAGALKNATTSLHLMQLEFDIPRHKANAASEAPEIVCQFGAGIGPGHPEQKRAVDTSDTRLERAITDAASRGVTSRIMMPSTPWSDVVLNIPQLLILLPWYLYSMFFPNSHAAAFFWEKVTGAITSIFSGPTAGGKEPNVADYFKNEGGNKFDVEAFKVALFDVVHAKVALIDAGGGATAEAIVIGSPFNQGYFDEVGSHAIDDPRRGSATGEPCPVHDVSMAIVGPGIADAFETFREHWDTIKSGDVQPITSPAALSTPQDTSQYIASLQLVRSINPGAFPSSSHLHDGEKGVLEAYLRAIDSATRFIYFETQYFTNLAITEALIAALKDAARPNLEIILMINIVPDIPGYPRWQLKRIDAIREEAGAAANRIEFFCAWTHESSADHPKPRIAPNYLHSKVGIVDGTWATVGSANLDGASLDDFELPRFEFGETRNHEVNYVILNGVDGHPTTGAVDALRVALWTEHLGPGKDLSLGGPNDGHWLALWKQTAEAKRSSLQNNAPAVDPNFGRVLAFPNPTDGKTAWPEHFLKQLNIPTDSLEVVDRLRSFRFDKGDWS